MNEWINAAQERLQKKSALYENSPNTVQYIQTAPTAPSPAASTIYNSQGSPQRRRMRQQHK